MSSTPTAEQILKNHTDNVALLDELTEWHWSFILKAMEEYASSVGGMQENEDDKLYSIGKGVSDIMNIAYDSGVDDSIHEVGKNLLPSHPITTPMLESILNKLTSLKRCQNKNESTTPTTQKEDGWAVETLKEVANLLSRYHKEIGQTEVGNHCFNVIREAVVKNDRKDFPDNL